MKKFTRAILVMIGIVLVGWIVACGNDNTDSIHSSKKDGRTVISWWTFPVFAQEKDTDAEGTYEKKLIEVFEEKNPDIKVELKLIDFSTGAQKIDAAMRHDTMGDVLFDAPGRIISYGKSGKLVKLNELFTADFCSDVGNSELLKSCKDRYNAYMYPISSAPFYMVFNRAMLKDAGVEELVKEGWTTDDFTRVLQSLKEKNYNPGSVYYKDTGGDQGTRAFLANLYNAQITNAKLTKYTFQDKKAIKALDYMKKAISDGLLTDGSYQNGSDVLMDFASGQSAFSLLWGPSQQKSYQKLLDLNQINTLEVPFPSDDGAPELEYLVNGFCIFDHKDQDRIDASKKFITFLCDDAEWGPRNVVQTGCIPVRQSFGDLYHDSRMQEIASWTKYYSTYYNTMDGYTQMRAQWIQMLRNVILSDKTPQRASKDFIDNAQAAVK